MVRSLNKEPTLTRKVKIYAKTLLTFLALVLFWYAIYEILGYMVVGNVTAFVAKISTQTNHTISQGNQTSVDTQTAKHLEGWITLAVGQSYFWFAVFLLVASQEIRFCSLSRPVDDKADLGEGANEGLEGEAEQAAGAVEGEERCFSTAKKGWQTPASYILRWNWNCMLGVMAWMGLDFTCDSVHIIIQSLNGFFPRLAINLAFLLVANIIFISLNQINGTVRSRGGGLYKKARKGKHYFRLNGARDSKRGGYAHASDKAAEKLLKHPARRQDFFQKLPGRTGPLMPPFHRFHPATSSKQSASGEEIV
ncbi:hypothetical protein GUITHDRAFT_99767 [Guillardia theta CCMP2712]|uniref:Uncharacterized protein n=1 Tax=Guillardia theta (strain CCMP2712) TaxID=905079 RepID=L1K0E3_GUITC|nr:hypothetical protein GUITHDRAFT_99767 [Guillardia theta CCMP2712]EKX54291.1 hypothetical protein GUITHDRAFT_99767 [Guillardia theta CCMP2712]|eukprot:XP_005841271.1 hypothetical protein GUITHDRAFT_99767 [Guillardia theta CCMP2712]